MSDRSRLSKKRILVYAVLEVDTIENGIAMAKEAIENGWEGSVRTETYCEPGVYLVDPGLQPLTDINWRIEDDQAKDLRDKLVEEFPKLEEPGELDVFFEYQLWGDEFVVEINPREPKKEGEFTGRPSKLLRKATRWVRKNPLWLGLNIMIREGYNLTREEENAEIQEERPS